MAAPRRSLTGMRSLIRSFTDFLHDLREGPLVAARGVRVTRTDTGLVVASGLGETVLDIGRRVVLRRQRVLARFAEIKAVRIREISDEDRPERWIVSLAKSPFGAIEVAVTEDDVEASILGARLSEVLGVRVKT